MKLENLSVCGLRVICILLIQTIDSRCTYRIYTSDGAFTDYVGYENVPEAVKEWMKVRNTWDYVLQSPCMFISGCKIHSRGGCIALILSDMYDRCQGIPDCCCNCMCSPDAVEVTDDYFWSCAYSCCSERSHQHNFDYCDHCCPSNFEGENHG